MKFFTNAFTSLFFICFFAFSAAAQNGMHDVRFNMNSVDCAGSKIFVDIEVRANSEATTFNISDQNYRFSYNRAAVAIGSVQIEQMFLTGFIAPGSFYDPHTLTGSLDSVVSYNVVLAGGTGVEVTTDWLTVGRISFEIIDENECLDLIWHDQAPENFPPTFIGEKVGNDLFQASEALYLNESVCPGPVCLLPVEMTYFRGYDENCEISLEWETYTETNNAYFQIEKSKDGGEFVAIGTVEGAGNSITPRQYHFTDTDVSSVNYYRITQVDYDGTSTTNEAIIIRSACYDESIKDGITSLYPNPVVSGPVNIKFYTSKAIEAGQIIVTDAVGRIVSQSTVELNEGPNTLDFSTERLAPGTYFVKIQSNDWFSTTQKFVKLGE